MGRQKNPTHSFTTGYLPLLLPNKVSK